VGALEQHVDESLDEANDEDEQGRLSVDDVDIVARPEEEPLETVSEARVCRLRDIANES
jgi:hypothetical protein